MEKQGEALVHQKFWSSDWGCMRRHHLCVACDYFFDYTFHLWIVNWAGHLADTACPKFFQTLVCFFVAPSLCTYRRPSGRYRFSMRLFQMRHFSMWRFPMRCFPTRCFSTRRFLNELLSRVCSSPGALVTGVSELKINKTFCYLK